MTENDRVRHQTVFDTDQQQLGEVYAKALLGFGQQAGNLDALTAQLDGVVDVIESLPDLQAALESPRISLAQKTGLLDKAFAGRIEGPMLNFLKVVAEKGRLDCLPAIRAAAHRLHDEMAGRVQAELITAIPVDESVHQKLQDRLGSLLGKQVVLTASVDPHVIGGMVVRVGDTVYDGSVANQLQRVRNRAVKRSIDAIRESVDRFLAG